MDATIKQFYQHIMEGVGVYPQPFHFRVIVKRYLEDAFFGARHVKNYLSHLKTEKIGETLRLITIKQ